MKETDSNTRRRQKRKALWFLLAGLVAFVLVANLLPFRRGPMHKGKPVSYWVDRACDPEHGDEMGTLREEVCEIGLPAIPYLNAKLQLRDTSLHRKWRALLVKLPLFLESRLPQAADPSPLRREAAIVLRELGPRAKDSTPYLGKLLDGPESWEAAQALAAIGPEAAAALPALKQASTKADHLSRIEMAVAIWKIDRETNFVMPIFEQAIAVYTNDEALNALNGLADMGPVAKDQVPLLLQVLGDTNRTPDMRACAAAALGNIGVKSEAVISGLSENSSDPYPFLRGNAAMALWKLDSRRFARMAVPIVAKWAAVDLDRNDFRYFAAMNHLDMEPALPALRELLNSDIPEVKKIAEDTLKELETPVIKEAAK